MIYQNNNKLLKSINKSGCNFLSLLWIIQIENKKVLSSDDINKLYKYFLVTGYIDKSCMVIKPDHILNTLLENKRIHQIGVLKDEKYKYWGWVKKKKHDWSVIQYNTTGTYGTHFVVGDKEFNEFYDPLQGKGYKSTGVGKILLYKIF